MRIQDTGRAFAAGFDAVTSRASRSLVDVTSRASRSLGDVANAVSPAAGPAPIRELLLDEEIYALIDEAVERIGVVLQRVAGTDGDGAAFYRIPTRQGPAALIQFPEEILASGERLESVNLVSKSLRGHARVVFVFTEAREIVGDYEYVVWPTWMKRREYPIRDVRTFKAPFLELLRTDDVEARLGHLVDNFRLDPDPPSPVQLEPADRDRITARLRDLALDAADPLRFLRDVVKQLDVSNDAQGEIVGRLAGGDLNAASAELVVWAGGESFPPDHERRRYTVVGRLLEVLHEQSGLEVRTELLDLVECHGLIRDRAVIAQLRSAGGEN